MENIHIRPMQTRDWKAVKNIYEDGIAMGFATFETSAPGWKRWHKGHLIFARLVVTINGKVIGWAALSPVSNRCVYGGVAEVSVYLSNSYRGQGIGQQLLKHLIEESEKNGIWTLQAVIFMDNAASIKLHENAGFRIIGYREKIGKLKDSWKDNYILERRSKIVGID